MADPDPSVVVRAARPWTPTVLALLRHFAQVGFDGAPRPAGDGRTPDGREAVAYVPGTSPHPRDWSDDAFAPIGQLLRRMHDATATFVPPPTAQWQPWFGRDLPGGRLAIGHCDAAPWNIVRTADDRFVLIDWEYAGPVDAVTDLAYAAWLNAQLHDDDVAERLGLPPALERAAQLRLILDGYGLSTRDRDGFVDRMIELAVHAARADAVEYGVSEASTAAVAPDGYPVLWGITWRARSASWLLRHRAMLERAIG
jgi:hypothetical protein